MIKTDVAVQRSHADNATHVLVCAEAKKYLWANGCTQWGSTCDDDKETCLAEFLLLYNLCGEKHRSHK